jgi:hypothetical protein
MVYVVERYLPGLAHRELLQSLQRLGMATGERRSEEAPVRYLRSTIVPGDEACFCEFEAPSSASVAEVNRRAGLPFHRIVPAVSVSPTKGVVR